MASGITLAMRYLRRPAPTHLVEHRTKEIKVGKATHVVRDGEWATWVNPEPTRDRSLHGKARRRAAREARRAAR